jgi:monofunctional glycosyltransferase
MNKKKVFRSLLLAVPVLFLMGPVYMYFSHDVEALKTINPSVEGAQWVKLKGISRFTTGGIILTEDWAFHQHQGVDVEQMKVALGEMWNQTRVRGASTITQQMVKNVFLTEDRTLWRKAHEIVLALRVEKLLSKYRILEIYLNVIEFGPNIYGIHRAARHYFKKSPAELSPRESAFLAMLLPSPKRYYKSFKNRRLTSFARARVNEILKKMRMGKLITQERYEMEKSSRFGWEN